MVAIATECRDPAHAGVHRRGFPSAASSLRHQTVPFVDLFAAPAQVVPVPATSSMQPASSLGTPQSTQPEPQAISIDSGTSSITNSTLAGNCLEKTLSLKGNHRGSKLECRRKDVI
ncbi:unnamed protein product [Miscanthus lutarioriparius]|uniref:Uncharacterized protein n=1 Tax=Miscanthus lutarioriparius TaxID=422564 RepID=A0A811REM5_9POAL|nr:unnamed protein product [Miscanthus lutarioriparius]